MAGVNRNKQHSAIFIKTGGRKVYEMINIPRSSGSQTTRRITGAISSESPASSKDVIFGNIALVVHPFKAY